MKEYLVAMFWSVVQAFLTVMAPFIVKFVIEYIKTGEDPYNFGWKIESIPWLTPEKQYGLMLIFALIIS